ncbi:MAG: NAD(P)-dependent oxidoreductase [Deltaproteobacteria bacterium]|nr:NAD(P)-dependent oxidoreductase [Deltaproteobacteria bacterium]
MRVFITGGAGRLGTRVCKAFHQNGFDVRLFDIRTPITLKRVKDLDNQIQVVWGDITDIDALREAMDEIDAVVHMAVVMSPLIHERPDLGKKVNVEGTKNIVDLIKEKGSGIPFVYTSSVAVFGPKSNMSDPVISEQDEPKPKGIYAETKYQGEIEIKKSGIDYVILRLASGWHLTLEKSDIAYMFNTPLNAPIEVFHPDDCIRAILDSIRRFDDVKGNTMIISSGPKCRIRHRDRVEAFLKILGLPMPPADRFSTGQVNISWYDTAMSQELLDYQKCTFKDYIENYSNELKRRYTRFFIPMMRYFIGPVFGPFIVKHI